MGTTWTGLQGPPIAADLRAAAPWIRKMPGSPSRLPVPPQGLLLDACNILYGPTQE